MATIAKRNTDPYWGDGHDANRALLSSHVDRLITAFEQENIRRYDTDCRMKVSISSKLSDTIRDSLDKADQEKLKTSFNAAKYSELVHLQWNKDLQRPTLEAGQHRRAAILKMNGLNPAFLITAFILTRS